VIITITKILKNPQKNLKILKKSQKNAINLHKTHKKTLILLLKFSRTANLQNLLWILQRRTGIKRAL
jgi:hypothetical protein